VNACNTVDAVVPEVSAEVVNASLGLTENDDPGPIIVLVEYTQQAFVLLEVFAKLK